MVEKSQLRVAVIGGIIATVVGGLILQILGALPSAFAFLSRGASWVLHVLGANITLPVWALIAFGGGFLLFGFLCRGWPRPPRSRADSPVTLDVQHPPPASPPTLSDLEREVMRMLVRADGGLLSLDQISGELKAKRLVIEQAIDILDARGFLEDNLNTRLGRRFRLSPRGRDFAIQTGLVS